MKRYGFMVVILVIFSTSVFAQISNFDIGTNLGTNFLVGDSKITNSQLSPNVGFYALYSFSPKVALKLQLGYGQMSVKMNNFKLKTSMIPFELIGMYSFMNTSKFSPFLHAGVGAINFDINGSDRFYDGLLIGGTGFSMSLSSKLSLLVSADMRYTTGDDFNGMNGGLNDGYFSFQTGITYHLTKPEKKFEKKQDLKKTNILAFQDGIPDESKKSGSSNDVYLETIQLRSKIEKYQNDLEKKDGQITELKNLVKIKNDKISLLESQIAEMENNKNITPYKTSTQYVSNTSRKVSLKDTPTNGSEVKQIYENALQNFNAKNYRAAISALTGLYNQNPNHFLSGNFVYWIGECYYGLGNYSAAIEAFQNVSKKKHSPKLDDALIMIGLSYLKIGNSSQAKEYFQELINKYPNSEYAGKAKRYLNSIQSQIIS